MESSIRFAPISSERSTRLELVVGYFALSGAGLLLVLLLGVAQATIGGNTALRALLADNVLGLLVAAAMAGVFLIVAWQLHRRSRSAAIVAATLLALSVADALTEPEVSVGGLMLSVIGLLLIASVWSELRPMSSAAARPTHHG